MDILNINNLFAWCIIPYDKLNRNSIERANMLLELGINSYAYDWREKHLKDMANELKIMKQKNIALKGVWLWLDSNEDIIFNDISEKIFKTLQEENITTDIWIGIPQEYFDRFNETEKLEKAVNIIDYTYKRAAAIGCTISLYNHGGWFGEPKNQIKIIEKLGYMDIGIIYNFHHAHDQVDDFEDNLLLMKRYLRAVNINGMKLSGPKILTVSDGDKELYMIRKLIESGYEGPIGILGHIENADVKNILRSNLKGVQQIIDSLQIRE